MNLARNIDNPIRKTCCPYTFRAACLYLSAKNDIVYIDMHRIIVKGV